MTIQEYKKKLEQLRGRVSQEVERIIYANEDVICAMNIQKIDDHIGSDGQLLRNTNKKYSGRYTLMTQMIAAVERPIMPKIAGDSYNWRWNGDFMSGFQIRVIKGATQIEIFSRGEGSGLKKDFFDGYKNLYGLTIEDQKILNYDIIQPELQKFIKQYI